MYTSVDSIRSIETLKSLVYDSRKKLANESKSITDVWISQLSQKSLKRSKMVSIEAQCMHYNYLLWYRWIMYYRYWHQYHNVWKDFKEIFEACHLHSFTNIDVCSHISHGLSPVPSILWKIAICYSISCIVENLYNDNRRGGLQQPVLPAIWRIT